MTRQILLCDDEVHILRAAEFKLSRAGFVVHMAHDGEEAWEEVQRLRPDFVVTDLQMPRLNGVQLCRRIREHLGTRDIPVVMLTAKGYEMDATEFRKELGLAALLTKPFSPRELLQIIEQTLEAAATPAAT